MSPAVLAALLAAGVAAGAINTLAGGGSFLTIAALVFAGLSPDVANATNRLGVLLQSGTSALQYRRAGALEAGVALRLAPTAILGGLAGAWLSVDIDPALLRQIIGGAMLLMLAVVMLRPERWLRAPDRPVHPLLQHLVFLGLGLSGGFLQAGVGVLLLLGFSLLSGRDLGRANGAKLLLVLLFTAPALALYVSEGLVAWAPGLVLAAGSALGGLLGARLALWGGAGLIRGVLVVVLALSGARFLLGS